jgi:trk system potassium uptake protein TrkH
LAICLSFFFGTFLTLIKPGNIEGNPVREGFAIVTFGWIILTFFGCIPLSSYLILTNSSNNFFYYTFLCFTDAFFEIMSGFTTTGATIFTDIEVLPKSILFWRSMTHWLGGMGIVTLALAIFPAFGITAYQMFRGEVPGPTTERLKPRLAQTAVILWGVYSLLTLVETILLYMGGMSLFESFCHAFGTMATGGFSTRNGSVGAYDSAYLDWIIIIFMFLAGMNFILHYQIIFHKRIIVLLKDREFHFYAGVILIAILLGVATLQIKGLNSISHIERSYRSSELTLDDFNEKIKSETKKISSIQSTLRYVTFQVLSITTTTGYCTADFDLWPNSLRVMLVLLMFFGGCAGSTGGGIKMIRIMVVFKTVRREVRRMIQPRLIYPLKIAGKAIEEKQVANILGFFLLFLLIFIFFSCMMSFILSDFTTAITSVIATLCNIGPGLSGVGATENYAWIPIPGKWILTLCMLLGRLEVYTVVIAFSPISWKK